MTRSYGTRPQSGKQARTSLALKLTHLRVHHPEMLAARTADEIKKTSALKLPEIEAMLLKARAV